MKRFQFRPDAEADLEDIWGHTEKVWGRAQANVYVASIRDAVTALANGAKSSRPADTVRQGYRKIFVGRHVVFFLERAEVVEVVRVLHERMDVGRV